MAWYVLIYLTKERNLLIIGNRFGNKILIFLKRVVYLFFIAGRLTLTDHALYFEAHRVVSYDKAKSYDLADDLQQVIKPELTGPWGARLFDKAIFYKSVRL